MDHFTKKSTFNEFPKGSIQTFTDQIIPIIYIYYTILKYRKVKVNNPIYDLKMVWCLKPGKNKVQKTKVSKLMFLKLVYKKLK